MATRRTGCRRQIVALLATLVLQCGWASMQAEARLSSSRTTRSGVCLTAAGYRPAAHAHIALRLRTQLRPSWRGSRARLYSSLTLATQGRAGGAPCQPQAIVTHGALMFHWPAAAQPTGWWPYGRVPASFSHGKHAWQAPRRQPCRSYAT